MCNGAELGLGLGLGTDAGACSHDGRSSGPPGFGYSLWDGLQAAAAHVQVVEEGQGEEMVPGLSAGPSFVPTGKWDAEVLGGEAAVSPESSWGRSVGSTEVQSESAGKETVDPEAGDYEFLPEEDSM
jgi:hypothetical protein